MEIYRYGGLNPQDRPIFPSREEFLLDPIVRDVRGHCLRIARTLDELMYNPAMSGEKMRVFPARKIAREQSSLLGFGIEKDDYMQYQAEQLADPVAVTKFMGSLLRKINPLQVPHIHAIQEIRFGKGLKHEEDMTPEERELYLRFADVNELIVFTYAAFGSEDPREFRIRRTQEERGFLE